MSLREPFLRDVMHDIVSSEGKAYIPQTIFFCRQRSQAWVTRVRSEVGVVEGEEEVMLEIEVDSSGLFFC